MEVIANNKRIAKNTMFLYIRMFVSLIVTLYTTRVVLQTLGVVDYGVYNTVAGFVTLFAFLNSTLAASMQRFYNFEAAREGLEGYKRVYSAGIIIHLFVMLIIIVLLEGIGVWYVNNVMVLPADRLTSANIVFQTSVISLCLLLISIPYSGAIMAAERMDFYAIVSIAETVLKLICVLVIPYFPYDKLSVYGVLLLLVSFISFLLYAIYAKKNILKFKFEPTFDRGLLKQMLSFSSWNVVGTFSFMLKGQALNMLLNFFFGPIINAARGIAFQVGNAITSFSTNITLAFKPQMVSSYAQGDLERVKYLFYVQSKICFALIAILITPVILNIDYILKLWLGSDIPQYTSVFSILVLLDVLVCSFNSPCTQLVFATGNIKNYQLASSSVNLLLLPVSWIALYLGFNATSIFVLTIVFSLLNQVVCIWQTVKVFDLDISTYLFRVIMPCCLFILLCVIPCCICSIMLEQSFFRLIVVVCLSVLWGSILAYTCLIDKKDRYKIKQLLKDKLKV